MAEQTVESVKLEFVDGPYDGEERPVPVGCVSIAVGRPSRGPWAQQKAQGSPLFGDEEQRDVVDGWYELDAVWRQGVPVPVMQWYPDEDDDGDDGA